ncbi:MULTISPECIES: PPE domain-containing protein [Actinosynnema]|uniref:PPE domain-containing protein n=1 Tax=Actinosynnema TaxID=40566 RepID=UPI0020A5C513|nr:PPE domain-containing protein [Actinosynnema pretiosum]MCP2094360.1 PPE-repeat protein [Actinosynnema pretiosum]
MGLGSANFDAQSHQQLYDKIHDRVGTSAAQVVDDAWNSFRAVMGNAKSDLQTAIEKAGAVWVGAAGERFTSASAPLVQWAEDARAAGVATHHSFQAQHSSYSGTAVRMPRPVEVTSTANDDFWGVPAGFTHLVGGQTDQDVQEAQALEAKREAVRVMVEYQSAAVSAVDALGTFTPPPSVATQVAEGTSARPDDVRERLVDHAGERDGGPEREEAGGRTGIEARDDGAGRGEPGTSSEPRTGGGTSSAPLPGVTSPSGSTHTSGSLPAPASHPQQNPAAAPAPPSGLPGGWAGAVAAGRGGGAGGGMGRVGGGTPGPGGFGGGPPSSPGAGRGTPGSAGPSTGVEHGAPATRPTGASPSATRGATGAPGATGPLGSPQRGRDEDDLEHRSADYLEELDDVWGQDGLPKVAPPVIGDVGP